MRNVLRQSWLLLPVAGLLLAGCARPENAMLDEARAAYATARSEPEIISHAPMELNRAGEALQRAENLFERGEDEEQVSHQAYLALHRAAIAREAARLKVSQEVIAGAEGERQRVLLAARSREAEQARQLAETRRQKLEEAQVQARERGEAGQQEVQALQQQLAELQAQETPRGLVLTLKDIVFEIDSSNLQPGAGRVIDKIAEFLAAHPDRTVAIEGFTDSTGPEEYNQRLSEARARSVADALVLRGIEQQRIITRGYGEQYPVASNENPTGRQLNRRVEIIVSNGSEGISQR
ncbi:MAG: DUF4398 and OmpA-like domain-containing protein [Desulfuromonadales bacterium]|nr:DUF4398 and OmpA-like domain-containing protein [Desulfuromonadales bacterium]